MMNVVDGGTTWHDTIPSEHRIKVCLHIMHKLTQSYYWFSEQPIREITSTFESEVYTHAESRADYLRRIARGLSNVEFQVSHTAATFPVSQPADIFSHLQGTAFESHIHQNYVHRANYLRAIHASSDIDHRQEIIRQRILRIPHYHSQLIADAPQFTINEAHPLNTDMLSTYRQAMTQYIFAVWRIMYVEDVSVNEVKEIECRVFHKANNKAEYRDMVVKDLYYRLELCGLYAILDIHPMIA